MKEIWKDVVGYEGNYIVSSTGKVKNLKTGNMLKNNFSTRYARVSIANKKVAVHRIVAKAFLPNPNNYETVNHIDENHFNNNVENLEWCTTEENTRKYYKKIIPYGTKIGMYSTDEILLKVFDTVRSASRALNTNAGGISSCLHGVRKHQCGYIWRFVDSNTCNT